MLASTTVFFRDLKGYLKGFFSVGNRSTTITLFVVMAAGVALRINYLWHPIRYDEKLTLIVCSRNFIDVLTKLDIPNNHILHSFLLKLMIRVFGESLWAIRVPALIAGILMIPAAYVFASIIYDRFTGLLAAALVATSSLLVEYSVLARGYTILLLVLLTLFALGAYLLRSNNSFGWILFSVLAALGFYTIPIMYYPFGVLIAWLFLSILFGDSSVKKPALFKKLAFSTVLAGALTVLLYTPVLLNSTYKEALAIPELKRLSWSKFFPELFRTAKLTWLLFSRDINVVVIVVLLIGFCVSLVFYRKTTTYRVPLIAAVLVWVVPVLLVQRVVSTVRARDWLFLLPLFL